MQESVSLAFDAHYRRGVPVLAWASDDIRQDPDMVQFLVWCNPSNIAAAGPALQADRRIASTALRSPFYNDKDPEKPHQRVFEFLSDEIRNDKAFVLEQLAVSSSYEIEFVSRVLLADKTVVAWAGAPQGSISSMLSAQDFVEFLKALPETGLSVSYVEEHQRQVFTMHSKYLVNNVCFGSRKICMEALWERWKETEKREWCRNMWERIQAKLPLFFMVSPALREVLWPTQAAPRAST